jgi:peroxiredoxin
VRRALTTFAAAALAALLLSAPALAGQRAPDFSLPRLGGGSMSLSSLKGKVVVLNFFRTFCPYCVREVPELNDLGQRLAAQGVEVLGMGLDGADQLKGYAAANKVRFPVLVCTDKVRQAYGDLPGAGGLRGVPTTVIVATSGEVARVILGAPDKGELERQVRALLPGR